MKKTAKGTPDMRIAKWEARTAKKIEETVVILRRRVYVGPVTLAEHLGVSVPLARRCLKIVRRTHAKHIRSIELHEGLRGPATKAYALVR